MKVMRKGDTEHGISGLFTFALVGLFAVLALMITVTGVNAYQSVLDKIDVNNQERASINYIINKVRAGDMEGLVRIKQEGNVPVLVLSETIDGTVYETRIFYYDGLLKERLIDAREPFDPEDGQELVELSRFDIEQVKVGLLKMTIVTLSGDEQTCYISVRSDL